MTTKVDSSHSYRVLVLCLAFATAGGVGHWSTVVLMPGLEQHFQLDRSAASSLYVLTQLGFGAGTLFYGRIANRLSSTSVLAISACSLATGYVIAGLTTSYLVLAISQFVLVGFLGSSTSFAFVIAEVSLWFERRRGLAVAVIASGTYLAGALWSPLLQHWMQAYGWRTTHLLTAALAFGVMALAAFALRKRQTPVESDSVSTHNAASPGSRMPPRVLQILLCVAGVCCCVAMAMPQVHLVSYCISLGLGAAVGAEMLALMLGFGVISRIVFGLIADELGGIRTLLLGSSLQCLMLYFFLVAESLPSLYLISVLFGLSQGGIVPSYALVVRQYFPASQAKWLISLVATATVAGMALGGFLPGVIFDATKSYDLAFVNGLAWNAVNITIIVWIMMRTRSSWMGVRNA